MQALSVLDVSLDFKKSARGMAEGQVRLRLIGSAKLKVAAQAALRQASESLGSVQC